MAERFQAPIPGQSLTGRPKNYPWERPPEIVDPEVALQMHLIRLSEPERMNTALDVLEFGVTDLYTLVRGLMRSAVSEGIHTVDVGMLIAPVVHEFIKQTADTVGIDYKDGITDTGEKEKARNARAAMMAKKKLDQIDIEPPTDIERDSFVGETEPEEQPVRQGLMAREEV